MPYLSHTKENEEPVKTVLEQKLNKKSNKAQKINQKKLYNFNYKDALLTDVINEFAAEKKLNIILPQPQSPNQLTTKLTYHVAKKLTLNQAWRELNKILELLGYSWVPHGDLLILTKINAAIKTEPLAVYNSPHIEDLPNDGTVIQTIFYFSNLKLSDDKTKTAIESILKSMLTPSLSDIRSDPKTNSIILTDKSNNIRAAMTIIIELDLEGIPDAIEVIPLYYTEAAFVEKLFTDKLFITAPSASLVREPTTTKQATYFPANTKVLALTRTNDLVIMGTTKAIRTVKDFIIKYIDHHLESGESILHLYDLQYLNAEDFQVILAKLVAPTDSGQAQTKAVGTTRDFQDVIIVAEKSVLSIKPPNRNVAGTITQSTAALGSGDNSASGSSEGIEQAGNRLIIAARRDDWLRIKKLIDELDKPQPQVSIEVLVVDLTLNNNKSLGSQMRNKKSLHDSLSNHIDFQTANIDAPIIKDSISCPDNY